MVYAFIKVIKFQIVQPMKKIVLSVLLVMFACQVWAMGEPSTYFNIFLPPNNDPTKRHVALIVTAIYDSTSFNIIDDDMDGDSDDSHSGMLMAGQSYVVYIKDNGVNDDADWASGGTQKADGDYFIITSDKLVYASQSTDSDWQHDWVPATNKSGKGQRFIIYAPKISSSNRDVNVFAYENQTTVTMRKISTGALNGSTGYTAVNIDQREIVVQRTINVGEDLINFFTDGRDVMESGHTYIVESNKEVTVQYGALHGNARDGGGYVPGSNGGSADELFYFSVPYQADREQEIRIVSLQDANDVVLERYDNGNWIQLKTWTLNTRQPGEWVGRMDGSVTYPTVFRVTCTSGKQVMVLEANWMETGAVGTSDMATMATSMNGSSAGKDFLVYMAPPGYEHNVVDPFTGQKFTTGSHAYLFAFNKDVTVTVKDANTYGEVINRTYQIQAGRYADCNLDQAQWQSIYNGTGDPYAGDERPYLVIESNENISVLVTNFNDNWMNYFGSSLEQSFKQSSTSSSTTGLPGDTLQIQTVIANQSNYDIENANVKVIVPDGATPLEARLTNNTTGETTTGTFTTDDNTGQSTGIFSETTTLTANTTYTVTSDLVVDIKYESGARIEEGSVLSVETTTSGTVDGVYQESSSSSGISVASGNTSNLVFQQDTGSPWSSVLTDSWTASWVDYDGDNDLDLFVPSYSKAGENVIFRNIGSGQFQQVSAGNLAFTGVSTISSTWADYDNDGDLDVAVANNFGTPSEVFINNGSGQFASAGINLPDGYDHGSSWVDANNDGRIDLLTTDFLTVRFNNLYIHNGSTLVKDANSPIGKENKRSIGASWADYDNDGFQDLFIPNGTPDGTGDTNSLYRNLGGGQFEKITTGDIATNVDNSVGSAWGDYNNDGFMDLFVANASNRPNYLYKNNGDGTFTKQNTAPFNTHKGNSHGCSWLDYDNDGDLDLLVVNSGNQGNFLYRNNGDETFTIIDYELITSTIPNARGVAVADMDKDGDLDVFVSTYGGEQNALFTNNGNSNHWLSVKLVGTISNRSAIGATLRVKAQINGAAVWQTRQVSSQNGMGGQNSLIQHIGLGNAAMVDSIEVIWPSGIRQYLMAQSADQQLAIVEAQTTTISGRVFVDANENCAYDPGEELIAGVAIKNGSQKVYTNEEGVYSLEVTAGTHTVTLAANDNWAPSCPASIAVNVTDLFAAYNQKDLAVYSLYQAKDLKVTMGSTAWRRGFKNNVVITYENNGTQTTYNETLTVAFDQKIIPMSASEPWTSVADTVYTWQIDSIQAGERYTIEVVDSTSLMAELGAIATIHAAMSDDNDHYAADNMFTLTGEIVGAVDPNDILAFPEGAGIDHIIPSSQIITYHIRFQNTGNYYAENIVVEDQLPSMLDMESFEMVSASHDYTVEIQDHKIIWRFMGIKLPDSTRDEPNSHGFIRFTVKPAEHINYGTVLYNEAAIYFDFEKPVITNTVWHTVLSGTTTQEDQVSVFPNPVRDKTTVSILDTDGATSHDKVITQVNVYSLTGNQLMSKQVESEVVVLDCTALPSGLYIIKVTNASGQVFSTRMVVE